jgi:hypothetical protein
VLGVVVFGLGARRRDVTWEERRQRVRRLDEIDHGDDDQQDADDGRGDGQLAQV